jgi:hypothetical protein
VTRILYLCVIFGVRNSMRLCDKSVTGIRLVKTENPSACATANCKVCESAIGL